MPIVFGAVSKNTAQFVSGTNNSVALTGFNPNKGDTVVVFATWGSNTTSNATCQDNVDGMYTAPVGYSTNAAVDNQCIAVFYLKGSRCTGGSRTITITFTGGAGANFNAIYAIPVSGAYGDIDVNGATILGNLQPTPGVGTDAVVSPPNVANVLKPAGILAFCMDVSTTAVPAVGTGFTSKDTDSTVFTALEVLRVTAPGTQVATFTAGGNNPHLTTIVIFDEIPAADPVYVRPKSPWDIYLRDPGDGDFPAELKITRWF